MGGNITKKFKTLFTEISIPRFSIYELVVPIKSDKHVEHADYTQQTSEERKKERKKEERLEIGFIRSS